MLRAVVADCHLGQVDGDLERFAALTAALASRGVGEAVFLGDLHRSLVGFERFWDSSARVALEALAGLRRAGVRVVLIEGNRDFFLDSRDMDPYRDAAGSVHSFASGGRRFLLEHGDLVNRRDRAYRFWRAVSKSGAARTGARLLPRRLARRLVSDTERRLARTNFSYRRTLPVDDLIAQARRHFAAGVDVVLWGHFHRPWVLADGGRQARVVPAWAETGAVVWVAPDGDVRLTQTGPEGQVVDTTEASWYQGWRGPEATR
jgi:UDP-2,3-diacylglucosamine pyrophosphatase LpxH